MTPVKWTDNVEPIRRLTPLDRGYIEVEDDLPFEFDCQHSCRHATQRREDSLRAFGLAAMVCVNILLWAALYAVVRAVWRALG